MSFHHTETLQLYTFINGASLRIAVFVVICALVLIPAAPAFAEEVASEENETTPPTVVGEEERVSDVPEESTEVEEEPVTEEIQEDAVEEEIVEEETESDNVEAADDNDEIAPVEEELENHEDAILEAEEVDSEVTEDEDEIVSTSSTDIQDEAEGTQVDEEEDGEHNGLSTSTPNSETDESVSDAPASSTTSTEATGGAGEPDEGGSTHSGEEAVDEESDEFALPDTDNATSSEEIEVHAEELHEYTGTSTTEDAEQGDVDDFYEEESVSEATTTDAIAEGAEYSVDPFNVVVNDSNRYQFGEHECVSVGGGTFYCTEQAAAEQRVVDDTFISSPDNDGDLEIFLIQDTEKTQLTHNLLDDAAPYYDPDSERLVWHRLVDDRYQVVSYDLNNGDEEYLTSESYNSMEPSAEGALTLWQAWIGSNWEIMLHDGKNTSRLTDNDVHDILPRVREEYIVWQQESAEGWNIALYDQRTGDTEIIESDGGKLVENPRFLLVYDSVSDNGDIETVGYNPLTKETVPLAATPAPLPEDIPEPDQTGEIRAIIQKKPSTEDEVEIVDTDDEPGPEPPKTSASSTPEATETTTPVIATSTEETTITIPPLEEEGASTTPEAPPDIDDVVVYSTSSEPIDENTIDIAHIEDVVIPPTTADETAESE